MDARLAIPALPKGFVIESMPEDLSAAGPAVITGHGAEPDFSWTPGVIPAEFANPRASGAKPLEVTIPAGFVVERGPVIPPGFEIENPGQYLGNAGAEYNDLAPSPPAAKLSAEAREIQQYRTLPQFLNRAPVHDPYAGQPPAPIAQSVEEADRRRLDRYIMDGVEVRRAKANLIDGREGSNPILLSPDGMTIAGRQALIEQQKIAGRKIIQDDRRNLRDPGKANAYNAVEGVIRELEARQDAHRAAYAQWANDLVSEKPGQFVGEDSQVHPLRSRTQQALEIVGAKAREIDGLMNNQVFRDWALNNKKIAIGDGSTNDPVAREAAEEFLFSKPTAGEYTSDLLQRAWDGAMSTGPAMIGSGGIVLKQAGAQNLGQHLIDAGLSLDTELQNREDPRRVEGVAQFGRNAASAAGTIASTLIPGTIVARGGKAAGLSEAGVKLLLKGYTLGSGAVSSAWDQYKDAKFHGASDDDAAYAAGLAALTQAPLELVSPVPKWLNKLVEGQKVVAKRMLYEAVLEAFSEAGTEGAQQLSSNAIARAIYEKNRSLWEGLGESSGVGGFTGGVFSLLVNAATRGKASRAGRAERAAEPGTSSQVPEGASFRPEAQGAARKPYPIVLGPPESQASQATVAPRAELKPPAEGKLRPQEAPSREELREPKHERPSGRTQGAPSPKMQPYTGRTLAIKQMLLEEERAEVQEAADQAGPQTTVGRILTKRLDEVDRELDQVQEERIEAIRSLLTEEMSGSAANPDASGRPMSRSADQRSRREIPEAPSRESRELGQPTPARSTQGVASPAPQPLTGRTLAIKQMLLEEQLAKIQQGIDQAGPYSPIGRIMTVRQAELESEIAQVHEERNEAIRSLLSEEMSRSTANPEITGRPVTAPAQRGRWESQEVHSPEEAFGQQSPESNQTGPAPQQTSPPPQPPKKTNPQGLRAKLDRGRRGPGGYINADILREIVDYGRQIFRQGMEYLDWAMKMLRDLGDQVGPHLRGIFNHLVDGSASNRLSSVDLRTNARRDSQMQYGLESRSSEDGPSAYSGMGRKSAPGKDLPPEVIQTGKALYQEGMSYLKWARQMVDELGSHVGHLLGGAWSQVKGTSAKHARNMSEALPQLKKLADEQRTLEDLLRSVTPAPRKAPDWRYWAIGSRLSSLAEESREVVSVPVNERRPVSYSNDVLPAQVSLVLQAGAEIASRYIAPHLVPQDLRAQLIFDGDSNYRPDKRTIFIRENAYPVTVAHEIAHDVEWSSRNMRNRLVRFLFKRGWEGEKVRTSEFLDNPKYSENDLIFRDQWTDLGGDDYTGRFYPDGSTEILSTGIQRLHEDPVKFYRTDPEFFEFVVNTLRGW